MRRGFLQIFLIFSGIGIFLYQILGWLKSGIWKEIPDDVVVNVNPTEWAPNKKRAVFQNLLFLFW
ncbi:MAG: hypothetical protein DRQ48_09750 [Gammaproteobacteria bacterium]|nr:MAG: hypothetical protein DRQ48_09750 [Gammaproteobacteria bacterium]